MGAYTLTSADTCCTSTYITAEETWPPNVVDDRPMRGKHVRWLERRVAEMRVRLS